MQENNFNILINGYFQRSRRLDSDQLDEGYVLLPTARQALDVMAANIAESSQRAFTWTGPYGCGKSSLALLLTSLVGKGEARTRALSLVGDDERICSSFYAENGWRVLRLVGQQGDLLEDIAKKLKTRRTIKAVISRLSLYAKEIAPSDGVLVIVDELGKYLEADCASKNTYLLQELAEFACRSKEKIVLIGILHQAMDVYAAKLPYSLRDEWTKVQGRFLDIPLAATTDETLELLSRAIVQDKRKHEKQIPKNFELDVEKTAIWLHKNIGSDKERFVRLFTACWPLNPVTALMLGPISRRKFSQNERSIYSFLSAREPHGFMEFLEQDSSARTYTLARYWDYLQANFESAILVSGDSHRWLTAVDAIGRAENRQSEDLVALAKTVAVIDLFRTGTRLQPCLEILSAATGQREEWVKKGLDILVRARVLIERKHVNAWAVYAGSDFDLESAMRETAASLNGIDLAGIVRLVNLDPVVARKHYLETGTMRWFNRRLTTVEGLAKIASEKPVDDGSAGDLVLVVPDDEVTIGDPEAFLKGLYTKYDIKTVQTVTDRMFVFGVPVNARRITELARDLLAINEVAKNPELEGDETGRNEVSIRRDYIRQALLEELTRAFLSSTWYSNIGTEVVSDHMKLIEYVSLLCDMFYSEAPRIINELINRDYLSGNIVAARKELISAMFTNERKENLSFTGHPPALALYKTLLKPLHRRRSGTENEFEITAEPLPYSSVRLESLWHKTTEMLKKRGGKVSSSDIFRIWRKPPFGMKKGPMPVLLFAYILGNRETLAIYNQGVFQAGISEAFKDDYVVNPADISLCYLEPEDVSTKLLDSYVEALRPLVGEVAATPLAIGRKIVKFVLTLPKWALRTQTLSPQALELRHIAQKADDPVEFVLHAIPEALKTSDPAEFEKALFNTLQELENVTPTLYRRLCAHLCQVLHASIEDWGSLNERAKAIKGLSGNMSQEAFVMRMADFKGTDQDVTGLWNLAAGKPFSMCTDLTLKECLSKIDQFAYAFRQQEAFAELRGRESTRSVFVVISASGDRDLTQTIEISKESEKEVRRTAQNLLRQVEDMDLDRVAAVFAEIMTELAAKKKGKANG